MVWVALLALCASPDFYLPDEPFDRIYFPDERFAIADRVDERRRLLDAINTAASEEEKRRAAESFADLGRKIYKTLSDVERRRSATRLRLLLGRLPAARASPRPPTPSPEQ